MFGFKRKKSNAPDTQIPYQVYETVHQPAARRKRWMIRLGVALLAATLLVIGLMWLRGTMRDDAPAQSDGQIRYVEQPPQENKALPQPQGDPAETPASGTTNQETVTQPE